METARRKRLGLDGAFQQHPGIPAHGCNGIVGAPVACGVGKFTRRRHTPRDGDARLARCITKKQAAADFRDFDNHVEPVDHRPRNTRAIIAATVGRPRTGTRRVAEIAAAAGVHCGHQLEPGRVGDMMVCAGNDNLAGFKRLPQRVEHRPGELGKLVKKQHAAMGQRDLAGPRPRPATDQCRHGRGMMRVAERARLDQPAGGKLAGN